MICYNAPSKIITLKADVYVLRCKTQWSRSFTLRSRTIAKKRNPKNQTNNKQKNQARRSKNNIVIFRNKLPHDA